MTKFLFIIVILLIISIYIHYYSKYNNSYEIVQTYLDKVNIDMLYERNPIVIYDSIKTPKQLLGTLFKYSYVSKSEYKINTNYPILNQAKFSFIYSTNPYDIYVNLVNPSYKTDMKWVKQTNVKTMDKVSTVSLDDTQVQYITLKLKPYQVVIIPMHWIIQTDTPIVKYNLDDFVSLLYFKMW
jgi:hypothetical protein